MKYLFLPVMLCLVLGGCEKDHVLTGSTGNNDDTANVIKEYFPLTIGSYWIYQSPLAPTDSVYISGDTIINGNTYAVFKETSVSYGFHGNILRDSGDYIVDQNGIIYFSAHDFTDTLYSRIIGANTYAAYKMDDPDSLVTISLGSFQTFNCKAFLQSPSCPDSLRFSHNFYAKNVGRIKSNFFYSSSFCEAQQVWADETLIRYHIEP